MTCSAKHDPRLAIDIGRMRERIQFQAQTAEDNGAGGRRNVAYATIIEVSAQIDPISALEAFKDGQTVTPSLFKVRVRYQTGISTAKRILWGSRILNIREVLNIEQKHIVLQIIAEESRATA